MNKKSTLEAFINSPYFSIKHTNYFDIYDKLLTSYIGKRITLVEVGILDGGSLFLWREFLGEGARIIGVDLNPEAIKWREYGFEIFIGDQSDPQFWVEFFSIVGNIHVLLDDGGHRNDQQVVTVNSAIPYILDGGMIIVEDTHTSFMKFEHFPKYSFIKFLEGKVKSLYARSDELNFAKDAFSKSVHSLEFFTGICVLHINRILCVDTKRIENCKDRSYQSDFRYNMDGRLHSLIRKAYEWVSWDYLTVERVKRYPRISRVLQIRTVRNFIRLFIVPIRSFLYLLLQLFNMCSLTKHIGFW
jgi:hypothetical protein